jgi:hypothetical protein
MAEDLWEELTTLTSSFEEDSSEEEEITTDELIDIPALDQETEQSEFVPLILQETVVETPVPPEPESPEPVQTMTSTAKINGVDIRLNDTAAVLASALPFYKKEERKNLSEDKRNDLFEKATKKAHTKYDLISLSLTDEDKLDDTYNLSMLIGKTKDHLVQYDMHDVFTILIPDPNDHKKILQEKDLFTEYPSIRIEEVLTSNDWYNKWPMEDTYQQNLQLTYKFFQSNVNDKLWEKSFESYSKYSNTQKGGPLFFFIMLQQLVSNSEEAARSLQLRLEHLSIGEIDGENVDKAVSQIRGAINRLTQIKKLPEDLTRKLLMIFQTTSVEEFNAHFKVLEQTRTREGIMSGQASQYAHDKLCELAAQLYRQMLETGDWNGTTTKGKASTFVQVDGKSVQTCWNCGTQGHSLNECKKAKNPTQIEKNKLAFRANKKKNRTQTTSADNHNSSNPAKTGKWAPPKRGESPKKVIDGKSMYYLYRAKKWIPDKEHSTSANVAALPAPAAAAAIPATTTSSTGQAPAATVADISGDASRNQALDVAVANATRSMQSALSGLADQFRG